MRIRNTEDTAEQLLRDVRDYYEGNGKYNLTALKGQHRDNAAWDLWNELYYRIKDYLKDE